MIVVLVPDLVTLDIAVEVMNALLLPLVLGFLVALAATALPAGHRPRHAYFWVVVVVTALTTTLGVYGGLIGLGG